jgi:hypothetical protein
MEQPTSHGPSVVVGEDLAGELPLMAGNFQVVGVAALDGPGDEAAGEPVGVAVKPAVEVGLGSGGQGEVVPT